MSAQTVAIRSLESLGLKALGSFCSEALQLTEQACECCLVDLRILSSADRERRHRDTQALPRVGNLTECHTNILI